MKNCSRWQAHLDVFQSKKVKSNSSISKWVNLACILYTYIIQKQPPECSVKKAVRKNFVIFTGKSLHVCNFIKKRPQHRCFPVINAKILRTPILKDMQMAASENLSGAAILIFRRYFKSSSLSTFYKILGNSGKFLGKHICQSLFSKVGDL